MTGWEGNYCGPAALPEDIMARWNFDPFAIGLLLAMAYWTRHSRPGVASVAVLAVVFLSPLCAMSSALFSARVVHHVLLVAVAAPLVALAHPVGPRSGVGVPFLLATLALWAWHLPVAYDAALSDLRLYWLMQASLFATAVWFWRASFSQSDLVSTGWVFLSYLAMSLLGALVTLAPQAIYATHASAPLAWGLTPLQDQQLGGLIMWVPAGIPFAIWAALLARRAWRGMGEMA